MRANLSFVWNRMRPWRARFVAGVVLLPIVRVISLAFPAALKVFIDDVIRRQQTHLVLPIAGALIFAAIVQAAGSLAVAETTGAAVRSLIASLREELHAHVLKLPMSWHDSNGSGSAGSRIIQDTESVHRILTSGVTDIVGGSFTAAFALVVLFVISARLTAIIAVAGALFFALFWMGIRSLRPLAWERARLQAQLSSEAAEDFAGIRILRVFRGGRGITRAFPASLLRWTAVMTRTQRGASVLNAALALLGGITAAALVWAASVEFAAGRLTVGGFATFVVMLGFVLYPAMQIVGVGSQLADGIAAVDRIRELLAAPAEPQRDAPPARVRGGIEFKNVIFDYPTRDGALKGASFVARAGQVTAIVGCSGAGKSTIVGLLAGFYIPKRGHVWIDGCDSASIAMGSYQQQIALVTQEPFLFSATIRENILLGRTDVPAATFASICRESLVDEFVSALPEGYETSVGERGLRLSGGQRQRICIARALLVHPAVLLLDEPTSSIDPVTETVLRQAIDPLMRSRTTIVIAHRLATVRDADQIVVVDDGRVVESGNHHGLIRANGLYRRMFESEVGYELLAVDAITATDNAASLPA